MAHTFIGLFNFDNAMDFTLKATLPDDVGYSFVANAAKRCQVIINIFVGYL